MDPSLQNLSRIVKAVEYVSTLHLIDRPAGVDGEMGFPCAACLLRVFTQNQAPAMHGLESLCPAFLLVG